MRGTKSRTWIVAGTKHCAALKPIPIPHRWIEIVNSPGPPNLIRIFYVGCPNTSRIQGLWCSIKSAQIICSCHYYCFFFSIFPFISMAGFRARLSVYLRLGAVEGWVKWSQGDHWQLPLLILVNNSAMARHFHMLVNEFSSENIFYIFIHLLLKES